jgi:hypothetical protein
VAGDIIEPAANAIPDNIIIFVKRFIRDPFVKSYNRPTNLNAPPFQKEKRPFNGLFALLICRLNYQT